MKDAHKFIYDITKAGASLLMKTAPVAAETVSAASKNIPYLSVINIAIPIVMKLYSNRYIFKAAGRIALSTFGSKWSLRGLKISFPFTIPQIAGLIDPETPVGRLVHGAYNTVWYIKEYTFPTEAIKQIKDVAEISDSLQIAVQNVQEMPGVIQALIATGGTGAVKAAVMTLQLTGTVGVPCTIIGVASIMLYGHFHSTFNIMMLAKTMFWKQLTIGWFLKVIPYPCTAPEQRLTFIHVTVDPNQTNIMHDANNGLLNLAEYASISTAQDAFANSYETFLDAINNSGLPDKVVSERLDILNQNLSGTDVQSLSVNQFNTVMGQYIADHVKMFPEVNFPKMPEFVPTEIIGISDVDPLSWHEVITNMNSAQVVTTLIIICGFCFAASMTYDYFFVIPKPIVEPKPEIVYIQVYDPYKYVDETMKSPSEDVITFDVQFWASIYFIYILIIMFIWRFYYFNYFKYKITSFINPSVNISVTIFGIQNFVPDSKTKVEIYKMWQAVNNLEIGQNDRTGLAACVEKVISNANVMLQHNLIKGVPGMTADEKYYAFIYKGVYCVFETFGYNIGLAKQNLNPILSTIKIEDFINSSIVIPDISSIDLVTVDPIEPEVSTPTPEIKEVIVNSDKTVKDDSGVFNTIVDFVEKIPFELKVFFVVVIVVTGVAIVCNRWSNSPVAKPEPIVPDQPVINEIVKTPIVEEIDPNEILFSVKEVVPNLKEVISSKCFDRGPLHIMIEKTQDGKFDFSFIVDNVLSIHLSDKAFLVLFIILFFCTILILEKIITFCWEIKDRMTENSDNNLFK